MRRLPMKYNRKMKMTRHAIYVHLGMVKRDHKEDVCCFFDCMAICGFTVVVLSSYEAAGRVPFIEFKNM
jgi:hypothetical protein